MVVACVCEGLLISPRDHRLGWRDARGCSPHQARPAPERSQQLELQEFRGTPIANTGCALTSPLAVARLFMPNFRMSHYEGPQISSSRFDQHSVADTGFALRPGAAAPSRRR